SDTHTLSYTTLFRSELDREGRGRRRVARHRVDETLEPGRGRRRHDADPLADSPVAQPAARPRVGREIHGLAVDRERHAPRRQLALERPLVPRAPRRADGDSPAVDDGLLVGVVSARLTPAGGQQRLPEAGVAV